MKSVGVNANMDIYLNKRSNKENPKFKVGDIVRISKY